jgi:hypothetical protein
MNEDDIEMRAPMNTDLETTITKRNSFQKLCKTIRNNLRKISFGEYRTPLYFNGKDSYKSATSGILTLLSGFTLIIVFVFIFFPIINKY